MRKSKSEMSHQKQVGRNKKRSEKGFSLVEFLVGSTITLGVVALSFTLLDQGQSSIIAQRAKTTAQSRARKVLNLMTTDIRATGCTPAEITAGTKPGLVTASANSIRVVSDRNGNGTTNVSGENDANDDVTYTFTNKTVLRYAPNDPSYNSAPTVLTNEIRSLTLRYYDSSGAELVPPTGGELDEDTRAQVTRITLSAVIETIENGKVTGTVTIDNPIALRNAVIDS